MNLEMVSQHVNEVFPLKLELKKHFFLHFFHPKFIIEILSFSKLMNFLEIFFNLLNFDFTFPVV